MKQLSFMNLLSLMFIYLKLTDQIDWNWFFVLIPEIIEIIIIAYKYFNKKK